MALSESGALDRLRNGGADRLADLLLDDVLNRPLADLFDAEWAARQLAAAARTAAHDRKLEEMLRGRIQELRKQVPAGHLPIPAAVRQPVEQLLQRSFLPDRLLVGRLLDHETAQLLLKATFQDMLISFARRLKPVLPGKPPGFSGFSGSLGRLSKLGEGVMGAVGHEVERQVEEKAREFMEAGVHRLVMTMADHLCDPRFAHNYGQWRLHAFDVVLSTDMRLLAGEIEKLDPDALVKTGAAITRALVDRPALDADFRAILDTVLKQTGDRSLRDLLTEAGGSELSDQGILALRDLLRERLRAVIETPAFALWWQEIVEGT